MGTAGNAVFIEGAAGVFQGEPAVQGDESLFEMELVEEGDAADNAQPVGHEAELVGIAEMPVDVHLLDGGVGFGMGRHGGIGGLIRVIGIIGPLSFYECLELSDDAVGVFGIVFGHPCLDAGGVKNGWGSGVSQTPKALFKTCRSGGYRTVRSASSRNCFLQYSTWL